jgi:hypothetical protein
LKLRIVGLKVRTMIAGREKRLVIEATDIDVIALRRQTKHGACRIALRRRK